MDGFNFWPKPLKPKKHGFTLDLTSSIVPASSTIAPNSDLYFIPATLKHLESSPLSLGVTQDFTTLDHHIMAHSHTGRTMATAALNQRWELKETSAGQTEADYKRQNEDQARLISDLRKDKFFYRAIETVRARLDGKFEDAVGKFRSDLKSEITKVENAYLDDLRIPRRKNRECAPF
jgi:hypothetical protein